MLQSRRLLRVCYDRWRRDEVGGKAGFVVPGRDDGVGDVQAIVEAHDGRVGGLVNPMRPGRVTVPHPNRDIPRGTLKSIEKQAGIKFR
jgi:hypothetical protein